MSAQISKSHFSDNTISGLYILGNSQTILNFNVSQCESSGHVRTNDWSYGNGIVVYSYQSDANGTIADNAVSGNRYGIQWYNNYGPASVSGLVEGNVAEANAEKGIYYYHRYGHDADIRIHNNVASGTTVGHGIETYRYGHSSGSGDLVLEMEGNQCDSNSGKGIHSHWASSGNVRILAGRNICQGNGDDGIYAQSTRDSLIFNNTMSGNGGDGLEIVCGAVGDVFFNDIFANDGDGIRSNCASISNINYNNLHDNNQAGPSFEIRNESAANIDGRYNYFGTNPDTDALIFDQNDDSAKGYVDAAHHAGSQIQTDWTDAAMRVKDPVEGAEEAIPLSPYSIRGIALSKTGIKRVEVQVEEGGEWYPAIGTNHWSYEWDADRVGSYQVTARLIDDNDAILTDCNVVSLAVSDTVPTTSGELSGDETWTPANGDILVTGDVVAPQGTTLTIAAGTVVRFAPTDDRSSGDPDICELLADGGSIVIEGTEGAPVLLRPDGDQTHGGQWGGVRIDQSGGGSLTARHCTLEYGTRGIHYQLDQGTAGVAIDHVVVRGASGDGIYVNLANATGSVWVTELAVENCSGRGAMALLSGGSGTLEIDRATVQGGGDSGFRLDVIDGGDWDLSLKNLVATDNSVHGVLLQALTGGQADVLLGSPADPADYSRTTASGNSRHGLYAYVYNSGSRMDIEIDDMLAETNGRSGILLQSEDLTSLAYVVENSECRNHTTVSNWDYGNGLCVYSYYRGQASGTVANTTMDGNRYGFHRYGNSSQSDTQSRSERLRYHRQQERRLLLPILRLRQPIDRSRLRRLRKYRGGNRRLPLQQEQQRHRDRRAGPEHHLRQRRLGSDFQASQCYGSQHAPVRLFEPDRRQRGRRPEPRRQPSDLSVLQ